MNANQEPDLTSQIDALIEQDGSAGLFAKIHERRRKLRHAVAKKEQALAGLAVTKWDALKAEMRRPITPEEATPDGMDYLCQTVQDCIDGGDIEDTVYALVRVWRKAWLFQPHLGPIEGKPGA